MVPERRDGGYEARELTLKAVVDWDANLVLRQLCIVARFGERKDCASRERGRKKGSR